MAKCKVVVSGREATAYQGFNFPAGQDKHFQFHFGIFSFNVVLFYLLFAAVTNQITKWVWIGIGLIFLEWLARNNMLIYTTFFVFILLLLAFRLLTN